MLCWGELGKRIDKCTFFAIVLCTLCRSKKKNNGLARATQHWQRRHCTYPYPTNKGGMQKWKLSRKIPSHKCLSMFDTESYAQSALINKIWPNFCSKKLRAEFSELSWNLFRGALLVGQEWMKLASISRTDKCDETGDGIRLLMCLTKSSANTTISLSKQSSGTLRKRWKVSKLQQRFCCEKKLTFREDKLGFFFEEGGAAHMEVKIWKPPTRFY